MANNNKAASLSILPAVQRRFFPDAQDRARVPVAFVTGFLGAGKTTLINALLRHPDMADTMVAVNEFGAVALDQHLIEGRDGDVLVLANGCLCCNLSGDAEGAMLRLFARREQGAIRPFRRLLIEPSGLADPAPLAQSVLRNPLMARHMRLSGIVAVVDALFGLRHLDEQPECAGQIALADRIALTKTDLADPQALRTRLTALNPLAPQVIVEHGLADPAALFAPEWLNPDLPSAAQLPRAWRRAEAGHAGATEAVILTHDAALDWTTLEPWLRGIRLRHAEALLRLKGLVAIDAPGPLLLHGVHHVLHPPVALEAWPDDDHATRLVLILRGADPGPIRAAWAEFTKTQ